MAIIYKITNTVNGKIYIGQTRNSLEYRFKQHLREARSEKRLGKNSSRFHNALLKYGTENFSKEILEETGLEQLNLKEIFWIDKYDSCNRDIGYNIGAGGESSSQSPEVRKKIGAKTKERWENNPEQAKRMRAGLEKATLAWQEQSRGRRDIKFCLLCGVLFEVANWNKEKIYCSKKCKVADTPSWLNYQKGLDRAREKNILLGAERAEKIKQISLEWALENKDYVLKIPFNKISPSLKELFDIIKKELGVVDARTIAKGICGKQSKKEMLCFLKDYVKIYAVPDQN